jgi:predicted amidohydrolase
VRGLNLKETLSMAVYAMIPPPGVTNYVASGGSRYVTDVNGLFQGVQDVDLRDLLAHGGMIVEPASMVTFFGGSTATFPDEGNLYRAVPGVAGAVNPGATGADNVIAVYSLMANSFDQANRGLTITAMGVFAANANTGGIRPPRSWARPSAAAAP